jgi:hypothetical protein
VVRIRQSVCPCDIASEMFDHSGRGMPRRDGPDLTAREAERLTIRDSNSDGTVDGQRAYGTISSPLFKDGSLGSALAKLSSKPHSVLTPRCALRPSG